jgi:hypothetical protein
MPNVNPILFGSDYVRIIATHQLGPEYEMDYVIERLAGIYDLVAIESSSLPLFKKSGDRSISSCSC